jgi:hypothetical protein
MQMMRCMYNNLGLFSSCGFCSFKFEILQINEYNRERLQGNDDDENAHSGKIQHENDDEGNVAGSKGGGEEGTQVILGSRTSSRANSGMPL